MFGREATEEMEITAFDPSRLIELLSQSCGAEYRFAFRFTPEDGGTRVEMEFRTRAVSLLAKLMAPMYWFMKGMMKKCLVNDLVGIKKSVEGTSAVAR